MYPQVFVLKGNRMVSHIQVNHERRGDWVRTLPTCSIMKVFLIFGLLISIKCNSQGRISGELRNFEKARLHIGIPMNGMYFNGASSRIETRADGKFDINVSSKKPGFIYCYLDRKLYQMYFTPGQVSRVIFNKDSLPRFYGSNSGENQLLSTLHRQVTQRPRFTDSLISLPPDSAFLAWQTLLNKDLQRISRVCAENGLDSAFLKDLIRDQQYYYINSLSYSFLLAAPRAFSQLAELEMNEEQQRDIKMYWEKWGPTWEKVVNTQSAPVSHSKEYSEYLEVYYGWFIGYFKKVNNVATYKNPSAYFDVILQKLSLFSKVGREIYIANQLQLGWSFGNLYYVEESIVLYNKLKDEYPQSVYLQLLDGKAREVLSYLKIDGNDFAGKSFLKTSEYSTLKSLIENNRGTALYIDLWATWCKPCIEEFKSKTKLEEFISGKPIKLLYISIDDPDRQALWKKMVSKFDLKGIHIIASNKLKEDIWLELDDTGITGAIPRYIIVDKSGNLVNKDAPRPSQHDELLALLDGLL